MRRRSACSAPPKVSGASEFPARFAACLSVHGHEFACTRISSYPIVSLLLFPAFPRPTQVPHPNGPCITQQTAVRRSQHSVLHHRATSEPATNTAFCVKNSEPPLLTCQDHAPAWQSSSCPSATANTCAIGKQMPMLAAARKQFYAVQQSRYPALVLFFCRKYGH